MKPHNRQIFEENRIHHETLVKAGYLKHLSGRDRQNLVNAMSEEFQPGYSADLWCPTCVANMILAIYRRYDQFLEEERRQQEEAARKLVAANVPADKQQSGPAIQTKANFPSHKNHQRK